jgi:hypothetical protein
LARRDPQIDLFHSRKFALPRSERHRKIVDFENALLHRDLLISSGKRGRLFFF